MEPGSRALIPKYHTVLVRPEPPGQFTARAVEFPEVQATAGSEQEAVEMVRQELADFLSGARMVLVDVLLQSGENPLLKYAGHADPNDPVEKMYLEELARLRREDLEKTLGEYCQEGPNAFSAPTT